MQTFEYKTIDKSDWPQGEWQDEPDKKQWMDVETGLPCLIVRGAAGSLCGYVGVSEGHPYFEKDYKEVDVDVHRGVTFNGFCQLTPNNDPSDGICHLVEKGENDKVWWLGFDCAHAFDYSPSIVATLAKLGHTSDHTGEVYRNFAYVTEQVQSLAKQLKVVMHATQFAEIHENHAEYQS